MGDYTNTQKTKRSIFLIFDQIPSGMNKIVFTEEFCQPENLYPFTLTRQIQDIRVGILTIREKWEQWLRLPSCDRQEDDYKDLDRSVSTAQCAADGDCLMVHGNVLPTVSLIKAARRLKNGEFLSADGTGIVFRFSVKEVSRGNIRVKKAIAYTEAIKTIRYPWDIFQLNDWAIREDMLLLAKKRKSKTLSRTNKMTGGHTIFIEKGAKVEHAILNASAGPIYIGKNAEVMEGAMIRGPFALGEGGCVKMGAKIYGATTAGPYCVIAGEVKNSVLFGYSNKAHDGYLGDSVVGEWCNMGAGTTNSNLKNNAGTVRIWTPGGEKEAGLKCGVLMGDYSRTAVNTSINTGTVIGAGCNVFGTGLTPKHIPNFSWGSDGVEKYRLDEALRDIDGWKKLKGQSLSAADKSILTYIYNHL